MELLPLDRLGGRVTGRLLEFGVLLPGVAPPAFQVAVRIIHAEDQFLQDIAPLEVPLTHSVDPDHGDYWAGSVGLDGVAGAGPSWGRDGRYVYRLVVRRGADELDWVIDPFARDFGVGKLSAVVVGEPAFDWGAAEEQWRTPLAEDLVYYEIDLAEYGRDLDSVVALLPYLADLGVNCLQLMPVNNVTADIDWGYLPAAQFGVDERLGSRPGLRRLVAEAHRLGMAVVLDVVYGHTGTDFAFVDVYRYFAIPHNPVMAGFGKDMFGESTGWQLPLCQDYFFSASHLWLDVFHVDGFRYDCVPNYWHTPFDGYGQLCYATYQHVEQLASAGGHWARFVNEGRINLIQCAEQLEAPREILERTYSTSTWQNETLDAAWQTAQGHDGALRALGQAFALFGYPETTTFGPDEIHQAPVQYLENHDHTRFLCAFGTRQTDPRHNELFLRGDRANWYRLQPYLIGLLAGARGAPFLFEGQELCEDYYLPDDGLGRVALLRPVQWEYFYSTEGRGILGLVRDLLRLRRAHEEFRRGAHQFYNDDYYLNQGTLLQSRGTTAAWSLVAINVTDTDRHIDVTLPRAGDYHELLHGQDDLAGVAAGETRTLFVPSNYGRIWRVTT